MFFFLESFQLDFNIFLFFIIKLCFEKRLNYSFISDTTMYLVLNNITS